MGDLLGSRRVLRQGSATENFIQNSGLNVQVVELSDCSASDQTQAIEQLRINASSAVLYNRTAVQCAAYTLSPSGTSHYTPYSVMLINPPPETRETTGKHNIVYMCRTLAGKNGDWGYQATPSYSS